LEPGAKNQVFTSTDREKIKINKKFLIYLFFLLISIILWYLNALSKDYITYINYPINYEDFPKGKALVTDLPESLRLKVKGTGFSIVKYTLLRYTQSVTLPVDHFRLDIVRKDNQYIYYLSTRYIKDWFSSQLNSDIQLFDISPDTLVFRFADVVEKKVLVKPDLDIQFEKQYMQNGKMVIRPDCVIVSGPQVLVDTLRFVTTSLLTVEALKDTLNKEVELSPVARLSFPKSKIRIMVPVEKFTEMTFSVPIETDNAPEGLRVRTFPGLIKVSCRVGVSTYDKVTPYMFMAIVNYPALIANSGSKAKVNLVKYPSIAHDIKYYPKSVDYIIEK
jgi:hypothetical protein